MNVFTVIEPTTDPATSKDIEVGDGESKTFQVANIGTDVVSIQIKVDDENYTTIADAELSQTNVAQRMLGPAIYRISKGATTAEPIVSCTGKSRREVPRTIQNKY